MSAAFAGRRHTAMLVTVLAVAGALGLTGCSNESSSIAKQAKQGDNKGYIAGDGQIESLTPGQRSGPVSVQGTTLAGTPWSLADAKGKVVVLNVWGAWCGPCQSEMPHLQAAWSGYEKSGKPVVFMGLDQRDDPAVAKSTLNRFKVTYPSLRDDGGKTLLGLQGKVVTTPTTLVLDQQGRIAARVSGETTTTTVSNLVDDVLSEKS